MELKLLNTGYRGKNYIVLADKELQTNDSLTCRMPFSKTTLYSSGFEIVRSDLKNVELGL